MPFRKMIKSAPQLKKQLLANYVNTLNYRVVLQEVRKNFKCLISQSRKNLQYLNIFRVVFKF
ncbi:MAG: hypothetical protein EAZ79_27045 [Oscillatoriales cyanobacterium]|nr:MAG: hypothetical protein EAZ79_27045 [Oscillatoriales cyanobacterium]